MKKVFLDELAAPYAGLRERLGDDPEMRYFLRNYLDAFDAGVRMQGVYHVQQFRNGELIAGFEPETPNIFPTAGLAYIANLVFGATGKAAANTLYLGAYKNAVTPAYDLTAATGLGAVGTLGEASAPTDWTSPTTNRPLYTPAATSTAACTNEASPASFVAASTFEVNGVFLAAGQAQLNNTGTLISAKRLANARPLSATDTFTIVFNVQLASA